MWDADCVKFVWGIRGWSHKMTAGKWYATTECISWRKCGVYAGILKCITIKAVGQRACWKRVSCWISESVIRYPKKNLPGWSVRARILNLSIKEEKEIHFFLDFTVTHVRTRPMDMQVWEEMGLPHTLRFSALLYVTSAVAGFRCKRNVKCKREVEVITEELVYQFKCMCWKELMCKIKSAAAQSTC